MSSSLKMYPLQLYHTQVGRHNRRNLSKKPALLHLLGRPCQIKSLTNYFEVNDLFLEDSDREHEEYRVPSWGACSFMETGTARGYRVTKWLLKFIHSFIRKGFTGLAFIPAFTVLLAFPLSPGSRRPKVMQSNKYHAVYSDR
jgi:hypothetical protein